MNTLAPLLPTLDGLLAAQITALIVILVQFSKPFIPDTDNYNAVVRAFAACLGGVLAVVGTCIVAPHAPVTFGLVLGSLAQGLSLGYAVTIGYAGGKRVVKAVAAKVASIQVTTAPKPAPAPADPAPTA